MSVALRAVERQLSGGKSTLPASPAFEHECAALATNNIVEHLKNLFVAMRAPDARKQKLIRLATRLAWALALDLLLLGLYFVLFDWFSSTYLRMHEWQSFLTSLNKVFEWNRVVWTGSSGSVFIASSVCASLTMAPIIVYFCLSKRLLMLDFCASLFLVHLILVTRITGIPTDWPWWVLKLACMATQWIATRFIVSQLVAPLRPMYPRTGPVERLSHIV